MIIGRKTLTSNTNVQVTVLQDRKTCVKEAHMPLSTLRYNFAIININSTFVYLQIHQKLI